MKVLKASLLVAAGMAGALGLQLTLGAAGLSIGTPAAAQASQTVPAPTPSFLPGPADVKVLNAPTVHAQQEGEWTVRLDRPPVLQVAPVQVAAPSFLRAGVRYAFTWAAGMKAQDETVLAVRADGWLLVSGTPAGGAGSRWLNASRAIAIEQVH